MIVYTLFSCKGTYGYNIFNLNFIVNMSLIKVSNDIFLSYHKTNVTYVLNILRFHLSMSYILILFVFPLIQ